MGDFLNNGSTELPAVKSDSRIATIPPSVSEWAAADANKIRSALLELRQDLIAYANSDAEEAAYFAAGAKIVIRLDLIGISVPGYGRSESDTVAASDAISVSSNGVLWADDFSSDTIANYSMAGTSSTISGGKLRHTGTTASWLWPTSLPDQTNFRITFDYTSADASVQNLGIQFRSVGGDPSTDLNFNYAVLDFSGAVVIYDVPGWTALSGPWSVTYADGVTYNIVVEVSGSSIKMYMDSVLKAQATTSHLDAGKIAIAFGGTSSAEVTIDNLLIEAL